jgi:hypothetical protein
MGVCSWHWRVNSSAIEETKEAQKVIQEVLPHIALEVTSPRFWQSHSSVKLR